MRRAETLELGGDRLGRGAAGPVRRRIDRLGALLVLIGLAAVALAPFVVFKANRIVSGETLPLWQALPAPAAVVLATVLAAAAVIAVAVRHVPTRLGAAVVGLLATVLTVAHAALVLIPEGDRYARVSPGSAAWLLVFALAMLAIDALARIRPGPLVRVVALLGVWAALLGLFRLGVFDGLSVMREYAPRSDAFWREAGRHLTLALGSMAAAVLVGLPVGVLCDRVPRLRSAVLQVLNMVQTVPSIALFGILMAPLGALAAAIPLAEQLGIRGIGAAPAAVALFLYSLLPVVANTVVGLAGVPPAAVDAAHGMGLTGRQRLFDVELPLALPVILTGVRIVLVQNIGLVTVAALIGGGGFGTFVFQGLGQTAMDLVLLGAVPTVALAFSAAVLLDAAADASGRRR